MKTLFKKYIAKLTYFVKRLIININIRKIANKIGILNYDKKTLRQHISLWKKLHKIVDPTWYKVYSTISGINDPQYVPSDTFFFVIEPKLNNRDLLVAYSDKNMYDRLWGPDLFPYTLIRNIHGLYYDHNYQKFTQSIEECLSSETKIIIKPSLDSGSGKNITVFKNENGRFVNLFDGKQLNQEYLNLNYKSDFLIQRFLEQHDYFKQFNSTSFNTIRITTYRSVRTEKVIILGNDCGILRFGRAGSIKDNWNSGGLACYINHSGKLNSFCIDSTGRKFMKLFDGRDLSSFPPVHKFQEAKTIVSELAKKFYYFRLLAFDVGIDNHDGIKIVEVNPAYMGIDFIQMQGAPLFNEYTDEVIEFCRQY